MTGPVERLRAHQCRLSRLLSCDQLERIARARCCPSRRQGSSCARYRDQRHVKASFPARPATATTTGSAPGVRRKSISGAPATALAGTGPSGCAGRPGGRPGLLGEQIQERALAIRSKLDFDCIDAERQELVRVFAALDASSSVAG